MHGRKRRNHKSHSDVYRYTKEQTADERVFESELRLTIRESRSLDFDAWLDVREDSMPVTTSFLEAS